MIDKKLEAGEKCLIDGDDFRHIAKVLRLKKGDRIVLSDGRGGRWRSEIAEIGPHDLQAKIIEKLPSVKMAEITLAQAVIKHDRTEFIIQKAIELGVSKIVPFTSERTILKFTEKNSAGKGKRWNKIALEAAKQSGHPFRPEVSPVMTFDELIKQAGGYKHKLFFYEGEETNTLEGYFGDCHCEDQGILSLRANEVSAAIPRNQLNKGDCFSRQRGIAMTKGDRFTPFVHNNSIIIMIGPEGGFTGDEVGLAIKNGFTSLKLGLLILRVETAAITAIALTQQQLGYFS